MPEGHTIHRLARFLTRDLAGHAPAASSPQGRFAAGAARIDGVEVRRAWAAGKHLFVEVDGDEVLHVHLGLFGRFRRHRNPPPEPGGAVRLRLAGPERTWDLSGATACELLAPDEVDAVLDRLGPDPLVRGTDPTPFVDRVLASRRVVGSLLMDQAVVAGIGNVYRAELLYRAGIDPRVPGRALGDEQVRAIWDDAVRLLRVGERLGRIVTVDVAEARPDEPALPPSKLRRDERLYVYRRTSCFRCGEEVEVVELEGRRAHLCPAEQAR